MENERVQKAEKRRGKKVGQVERRRRIKSYNRGLEVGKKKLRETRERVLIPY